MIGGFPSVHSGRSTYKILKWQFFPLHEAPDREPHLHGGSLLPAAPDAWLHRLERGIPMNINYTSVLRSPLGQALPFPSSLLTDGKKEDAESFSGT